MLYISCLELFSFLRDSHFCSDFGNEEKQLDEKGKTHFKIYDAKDW